MSKFNVPNFKAEKLTDGRWKAVVHFGTSDQQAIFNSLQELLDRIKAEFRKAGYFVE